MNLLFQYFCGMSTLLTRPLFNSGFNISSGGFVQFGREISSRIQCAMNLRTYPHDVQICRMMFMSYQRKCFSYRLPILSMKSGFVQLFSFLHNTLPRKIKRFEMYVIKCIATTAETTFQTKCYGDGTIELFEPGTSYCFLFS